MSLPTASRAGATTSAVLSSRLVTTAVAGGGAVASLLLVERSLTDGRILLLVVVAGAALFSFAAPRAVVLLLVVVSATAFAPSLLPLNVFGLSTDLPELLTYATIGSWLVARAIGRLRRNNPLTAPIVLLVGAAAVGAAYGLLNGGERYVVQGQLKAYLTYLVALPLAALFATVRQQRFLERSLMTVATVASVYVLASIATGRRIASGAVDVPVLTLGVVSDVQRVRPALLSVLLLVSLLLIGRICVDGFTLLRVLQAALFSVVWAFSFNRSSWLALFLAALVLVRLRPGDRRPLRGLRAALVVLAIVPAGYFAATSGALGSSGEAIALRAASLVQPNVVQENSFVDRADEVKTARAALADSPIFGVGLGRSYGAKRPVYSPDLNAIVLQDRPFAHNSLLLAYLQLGVLGVAAFVLLGWRVSRTVSTSVHVLEVRDGARCVAAGSAVLAYFIASLFQTNLVDRASILGVCLSLAMTLPPRPDAEPDR